MRILCALVVCTVSAFAEPSTDDGCLASQNQRAIALASQGRLDEATVVFREVYGLALQAKQNLVAAQAAGYLGTLYRFRGDAVRAIPLLRFAKSQFAPGSLDAAHVSAQLGAALAQDGNLAAAEQELRSAGASSSAQVHLAAVLVQRKQVVEAEAILRNVLIAVAEQDVATRSIRAFAHLTLARILLHTDRAEADTHFRSAITAYQHLPFPDHPERLEALREYDCFRKSAR